MVEVCGGGFWPKQWKKKYFPLYWYITLCYCLPFLAVYTALNSGGQESWFLDATLALLLLLMLVDWSTFIWLSFIGASSAYLLESYCTNLPGTSIPSHELYLFAYFCVFLLLSAFFFMRKKDINNSEKLEIMQILGGAIAHEVNSPLAAIRMFAMTMNDITKKISQSNPTKKDSSYSIVMNENDYQMLIHTIPDGLMRTSQEAGKVVEILLISLKEHYDKKRQEHYIEDVVLDAIHDSNLTEAQHSLVKCDLKNNFVLYGSRQLIKQVINNVIHNAFKHGGSDVTITIRSADNKLYIRDNGKGIPQNEITEIFRSFYTKSKTGTGIGLSFCNIVMKSIGGSIVCSSELGSYTEFTLSFPYLPTI